MTDPTTSLVTPPPSCNPRTALTFFAVTFLAVVGISAIYAFHQPPVYYAQALTELHAGSPEAPDFLTAQAQTIQSREVLYPVIDNLRLIESWGFQRNGKIPTKEEVYTRLLDALEIIPVRGTNIIHIGVYARERNDAPNIANMVRVVYAKHLREMSPPFPLTCTTLKTARDLGVSFRQMNNIKRQIAWGAVAGLFLGILSIAIPLCWKSRKDML